MDPSADEDDDGKTRPYEGYNYTRCRNVVKLVKPDDKDADEKARAARPDAFTVVHSFYIRGRPDEEAQPAKKPVKPDDKDADEKARAARPDAFVDGKPFYIRGGPAQPAKKPVKPEEKDADEDDDEAQLAKLEDRRIHLMQVRKAAAAREARRSDNEAGILRPTFRTGDKYPKARIEHRRAGDERLLRYYRKHDTFAGAEVFIKPNVCTDPRANCHVGIVGGASSNADDYYKVDIRWPAFMSVDQYPKAQIEHGRAGDDLLARYYCKHNTFAGAYVYIKPNGCPEPVIEERL